MASASVRLARRSRADRPSFVAGATAPNPASLQSAHDLEHALGAGTPVGVVAPGSIEGLCTAVGVVYLAHSAHRPVRLHGADACQPALGETLIEVGEDMGLAYRLLSGFERATSSTDARRAIYLCQSDSPARARILMDYIRYGFDHRERLWNHRSQPTVADAFDLARTVSNECEHARQFVRFHRTSAGIYYARFEPSANVIPLVMDHFTARFNTQPFLIHDPRHHVAGVWDGAKTQLVSTKGSAWEEAPCDAREVQDDRYYQALWKRFYDSIAVEARTNHDLRRHFMPLRFWKNLPEMDPRLDEEGATARTYNVASVPPSFGAPEKKATLGTDTQKRPALPREEQGAGSTSVA